MKKIFIILLVLCATGVAQAADRFQLFALGQLYFPKDAAYTDLYGANNLMPQLQVGLRLFSQIYIYGRAGLLSDNAETHVLAQKIESHQTFLGGGIGYRLPLFNQVKAFLQAGICTINYKEKSFGEEEISGNQIALAINAGLTYHLGKTFSLLFDLGYLAAKKQTINDIDFELGGFSSNVGVGVSF